MSRGLIEYGQEQEVAGKYAGRALTLEIPRPGADALPAVLLQRGQQPGTERMHSGGAVALIAASEKPVQRGPAQAAAVGQLRETGRPALLPPVAGLLLPSNPLEDLPGAWADAFRNIQHGLRCIWRGQ
eukprot:CAMPEP_0179147530 /NCGR_PEP_ID=MMETSP0796-20121207/71325_1 /TAXON_ID=73915 /ORGANISM="Pyrodinium bahamense, Strain pbaha01" /LENGTH=127 /DNA_ID=CAMNT_0020848139 /DNA_START=265 /DNA_END=645 /DNA_ORIENTATION=-